MPQLFTIAEVADYLGLSRRTIENYLADGLLPFVRVGPKVVRIRESDLVAFVEARREVRIA